MAVRVLVEGCEAVRVLVGGCEEGRVPKRSDGEESCDLRHMGVALAPAAVWV